MAGGRTREYDGRRTSKDDLETYSSYHDISNERLVLPALGGENEQIEAQDADVADNGKLANPVSPRPEPAKHSLPRIANAGQHGSL